MRRISLTSMFGQTALLLAAALLVAQIIGFFLLVNERDRWRLIDTLTPAVDRFAQVAHDVEEAPRAGRVAAAFRAGGFEQHFMLMTVDGVTDRHMPRQSDLAAQLRKALDTAGVKVLSVDASSRGFADSPARAPDSGRRWDMRHLIGRAGGDVVAAGSGRPSPGDALPGPLPWPPPGADFGLPGGEHPPGPPPGFFGVHDRFAGPPPEFDKNSQEINLSAHLADGSWLNADFLYPAPPAFFLTRLGAAEIILYAVVLAASLLLVARVIRPLDELARAAQRFGGGVRVEPIAARGPSEVRAAVSAFNAMARRVSDLLHEKDHMIAAIGHDLRTPLAALRVRAEAVEPEVERERMIQSLDDISKMVDDILSLARPAGSGEPFALVDLAALVDSVVEEFTELGRPVTFAEAPRTPLRMQPASVKRLLRNLIENAVKFGDRARVSLAAEQTGVSLIVDDDGPGIPDALLAHVTQPFVRLEESRSRETGGIGLGLAIATAIAHSQGAELELSNRATGGLRASVRWSLPQG